MLLLKGLDLVDLTCADEEIHVRINKELTRNLTNCLNNIYSKIYILNFDLLVKEVYDNLT
jgi:hypothetical protein